MTIKRRDAIKTLGAMAGAAGLSRLVAGCGSEDDRGGPGAIDTFVFLMMENRSYDHFLGSRKLVEGLGADGLTAGLSNPNVDGAPVTIWTADAGSMCVLDPPHGWESSRVQLDGGSCSGFVRAHQQDHGSNTAIEPMQYMLREHVPVTHALADAYTSCDRWFSSVLGPTMPNRMYWHAGQSNGAQANNAVIGGAFKGIPTIHHRLDQAGIDWAYYYGDVPVVALMDDLDLAGRMRPYLYDFIDDAAAGRLPRVSYLDPAFSANDDHPPHHPLLGQQLIASVYQALATSPHWERCMLVVTYDENGGFYDHVAPLRAADDRAAADFDQLGFRVPTLVAGPYAKQGYVSSVTYDHTSALKHLETQLGLEPLTARSTAAADLLDCLDLDRLSAGEAAAPVALPAVEIDESALPDACKGSSLREVEHEHELLAWAGATTRLGRYDRRRDAADTVYGIAEYLDRHGLGRIRRR